METSPSLDRLVMGLCAGAAAGAFVVTSLFTSLLMFAANASTIGLWQFVFTAVLLFLVLALMMPLTLAPLWLLLRALRIRDSVAATMAGGLAFTALGSVAGAGWSDYVGPPPTVEAVAQLASCGIAGLVAGFVAWRVAY